MKKCVQIRLDLCLAVMVLVVFFSGCAIDHGGEGTEKEKEVESVISGTVSVGGPLKGVVTLKNATATTSSLSSPIDENGRFSFHLISNMTGPYILQAKGTVGGRMVSLHSIGTRSDLSSTVNITPLTNLVVGNITGKNPEEYFNSFEPALSKIASEESINRYESHVRHRFYDILQAFGLDPENVNLINTPIETNHSGMDAVFDFTNFIPAWEEGNGEPRMRIRLLVSGDEIIDDLTRDDDTDRLSVPVNLSEARVEMEAILQLFDTWQNYFSADLIKKVDDSEIKGMPEPQSPELLALFANEVFYQNGYPLAGFLERLCGKDPEDAGYLENMSFSGLALDNLDLDAGKAVVSFTVNHSGGYAEDQLFWNLEKTNGTWTIKGNQQRLECHIGTYAAFSKTKYKVIANGLCIYAWTPFVGDTSDIQKILVSGKGLADGLELVRVEKDGVVLYIPEGSSPEGYYGTVDWAPVTNNATYRFRLFDGSGHPIEGQEYTRILKRGNMISETLFDDRLSYFCELKAPSQTKINVFEGGGGTLDSRWSIPSGNMVKEINVFYDHASGTTNMRHLLDRKAISHSATVPETGIMRIDLNVRSTDAYGRLFDVFVSDIKYTQGTRAKNIIVYGMESGKDLAEPFRLF